nr:endolytic transglycosylase MltG [Microlunatus panaciterrae]
MAVLVGGGYFVYDRASSFLTSLGEVPDYVGAGKDPVTVTIPKGSSLDDVGDILLEKDVIKSVKAWDRAVQNEQRSSSLQAGTYALKTQLPAVEALRRLLNPSESQVRSQFTVTEGLRLSDQIDSLVKSTKIKKADYQAALKKPQALGLPKYAGNNPEGLLFPETYELTGNASATTVLKQMVGQYNRVAKDIDLEGGARELGYSPYEVLIVASIIEREVNVPANRPKVARVIYNRLHKKMRLQMDSTVHYAVHKGEKVTTTDADRRSRSPYNTYVHKGLPPGPISAPGRASLQAAINPTPGNWLYFVTVNLDTGETRFTNDKAVHDKNVADFRRWCQAHQGRC